MGKFEKGEQLVSLHFLFTNIKSNANFTFNAKKTISFFSNFSLQEYKVQCEVDSSGETFIKIGTKVFNQNIVNMLLKSA